MMRSRIKADVKSVDKVDPQMTREGVKVHINITLEDGKRYKLMLDEAAFNSLATGVMTTIHALPAGILADIEAGHRAANFMGMID